MDPSQSGHSKQEDTRGEDTAIMLFGKQIKNHSNAEKVKEELSPRGVDEKGLSFATSSDDDEDLYQACENSMHVAPMGSVLASETSTERAKKRKAIESGCMGGDDDAEKPKSIATESTTIRMGGDDHAEQLKSSMWSRCPRCSSADTKFCYFNNYNVNQPRHFCKHCQRYWTAGGTLRNVPIGAGKRKNKHTLHKNGFVTNSPSEFTIPTSSLPLGVSDANPLPMVKSEPLPTPESGDHSILKTDLVNTNLELSTHNPSTADAMMSSLPACNIIHPHSAHKLITLHQLQEPQSRLSQLNPHSFESSTNFVRNYPSLACGQSSINPVYPELASNLACGQSSLSQGLPDPEGLHQINPFWHNGLYGLNQIYPHLRGGFPGLTQTCPDLQSGSSEFAKPGPHLQNGSFEFAKPGPHLQSGLCNLCHTCLHVPSGSCRTSQECLDCKRKETSGLAKSESGFSEVDEMQRNVESELPSFDQKSTSLERGLPDMVRIASEKQNRASSLQIGHSEMCPQEVDKCMQRLNEIKAMGGSAANECKAGMRGLCHGTIDTQAAPMCLQGNNAQTSSTSALAIKSEDASNIENLATRGAGEGQNSLLNIWGSLWPCFYNMFWLDPLAFSHVKPPILTPQGWALPFTPPSVPKLEPTSYIPHSITSPTINMSKQFDSSGTLTASSIPTTLLAPFEDIYNSASNIGTTSQGKHLVQPPTTGSWQCRE